MNAHVGGSGDAVDVGLGRARNFGINIQQAEQFFLILARVSFGMWHWAKPQSTQTTALWLVYTGVNFPKANATSAFISFRFVDRHLAHLVNIGIAILFSIYM
jgi:hypothetical protein